MDGPRNVTATFNPPAPTFALTVALAGTGTGTVTGPGINCPGDCTETYPAGTPVTLTATADGDVHASRASAETARAPPATSR